MTNTGKLEMNSTSSANAPSSQAQDVDHQSPDNIFRAVHGMADQLHAIEKFISRRFDEISMEINATSQQVDLAEEGITKRFAEILEILKAISFSGDGNTPANAGVELDAVVDMTEEAANRILDAASRINDRIHTKDDWEDSEARQSAVEKINQDVEEIFLACSFQDLTGQRIRKTLENLRLIEDRLNTALDKMGIELPSDSLQPPRKASSQAEVDAMFKGKGE